MRDVVAREPRFQSDYHIAIEHSAKRNADARNGDRIGIAGSLAFPPREELFPRYESIRFAEFPSDKDAIR